jgi:hypothetical protein
MISKQKELPRTHQAYRGTSILNRLCRGNRLSLANSSGWTRETLLEIHQLRECLLPLTMARLVKLRLPLNPVVE